MFRPFNIVSGILVLVGAIAWGIIGLFNFNVIGFLFGEATPVARALYILVGLSALWQIVRYRSALACYWSPSHAH